MVLITGGMGFIGLHTARKFLDAGENVVITRFRTWREPSFIKDEYGKRAIVEGLDTTNAFDCIDLLKKHKVDSIVHLAVPALGALSPAEDYRTNMGSLINILEAGRIAGVKRISIASSTAVYASGLKEGPFREDQFLPISGNNPTEVYKKSFEIIAQHWSDRTKVSVLALRIGGIWGPLYHSMANLPSRMVHGALKHGKVDLSAGPAGMPFEEDAADLCFVKDCAKGIQMVHMATDLKHRVYNVASGVPTSNARLREAVLKQVPGVEIALKPGKGPRYRANACLDITRATTDCGYKPDYTVESGIAEYVSWIKAGNAN